MATYFRLLDVARQFLDSNGNPLSGGKLYTYEAGTTTNKATYQDDAGGASHANPIILDSAGRIPAEVWGTTGAYKLKLDSSADSTIWTADDIVGINDSAATDASEWVASGLTPTYASASSFTFSGDQTTVYHAGRRLKITDGAGTIYGTISASSYADPTTTITVAVDNAGSITSPVTAVQYGLAGANNPSSPAFPFLVGPTASTSGTAVNFTGVPAWVKKITISFNGVSTNGTAIIRLVLGDSGGVETSAYAGDVIQLQSATAVAGASMSNAFSLMVDNASGRAWYGQITLALASPSANTWTCASNISTGGGILAIASGRKALSSTLTQLQFSAGGTDTFDAGAITVLYE